MSQGLLVSIVSPSGGGKTTVVNELVKQLPNSVRLVTSTTRSPRPGEIDGVDYHFLTRSEFVYKIVQGDFAEHIQYAGNYYGIDRHEVELQLSTYQYVLAPIDVQGSESLRVYPYHQIRIFLKPESLEVLRTRLARRPNSNEEEISRRLGYAEVEIAKASEFDAIVTNHEGRLAETIAEVKKLLSMVK